MVTVAPSPVLVTLTGTLNSLFKQSSKLVAVADGIWQFKHRTCQFHSVCPASPQEVNPSVTSSRWKEPVVEETIKPARFTLVPVEFW